MKVDLNKELKELELRLILQSLSGANSISEAARSLCLKRTALVEKIKAKGIVLTRSGHKILKVEMRKKVKK